MKVLLLRLEAPLMAFGGIAIDNYGVTDEVPSASLLTGLVANALGIMRSETDRLQELQARLRYAVRVDRPGQLLQDFQTVKLAKNDTAWTTRGLPESRKGGAGTYDSPHLRYRQYYADASVTVALQLDPPEESPTPDECAAALVSPARPLFIGRKTCLPSEPLLIDFLESDSLIEALRQVPLRDADVNEKIWLYQRSRQEDAGDLIRVAGQRNWGNDVHEGIEYWQRSPWGEKL